MPSLESIETVKYGDVTLEASTLSELDFALVNALQLSPRASWVDLAGPLGTTPSTLARRWERLTAAGLSWVTASPGRDFARRRCISYVLIRTTPNARTKVVKMLASCSEVATVEVTTGAQDVIVDVLTTDLRELNRFLAEKVYNIAGITSASILLTTSLYLESSRWRLRSLDRTQLKVLNKGKMSFSSANYAIDVDALDRSLLGHLVRNGRSSWAELAELTGASAATARRRVNLLTSSGIVTFRCEIAHSLAGWPIQYSLLGRCAAADLDRTCQMLATWPECRFVAAVTGATNIYASFWVRDLGDTQRLEAKIADESASMVILETMVALETPKRMGHLCNEEGRRIETVPISPW